MFNTDGVITGRTKPDAAGGVKIADVLAKLVGKTKANSPFGNLAGINCSPLNICVVNEGMDAIHVEEICEIAGIAGTDEVFEFDGID